MATIRASCPDCGDVELTSADVTVRVCADDESATYSFRCPTCTMTVSKAAEQRIIDLLLISGVTAQVWHLPAELDEPRSGPALSHDDLLTFHELLQDDGWFERLSSMVVDG
jgi:hypothetical protein